MHLNYARFYYEWTVLKVNGNIQQTRYGILWPISWITTTKWTLNQESHRYSRTNQWNTSKTGTQDSKQHDAARVFVVNEILRKKRESRNEMFRYRHVCLKWRKFFLNTGNKQLLRRTVTHIGTKSFCAKWKKKKKL